MFQKVHSDSFGENRCTLMLEGGGQPGRQWVLFSVKNDKGAYPSVSLDPQVVSSNILSGLCQQDSGGTLAPRAQTPTTDYNARHHNHLIGWTFTPTQVFLAL